MSSKTTCESSPSRKSVMQQSSAAAFSDALCFFKKFSFSLKIFPDFLLKEPL